LQSPQISHDAELILPQGGLTRGHLFELTRMAVDSSVYDAFDGVCSRDAGVALHIWLYHLQGGEASQLPLPTASRTPLSSKLRRDAKKALEEHELALKSSNKSIDNKRRRSAQGGASLESLEANLATLRAAPYEQPFRWNGLQPTSAAPARTASGGGGGGGGAPPPGAAERERRLGCKLSLALGTHRRVGQDCPFRTFADEGGRDVLRFIAELGLTDDSGVWIPRPANHAQTLSYLNCRMQVELNNVRTQLSEALVLARSAQTEGARAMRREEAREATHTQELELERLYARTQRAALEGEHQAPPSPSPSPFPLLSPPLPLPPPSSLLTPHPSPPACAPLPRRSSWRSSTR
jgi:hypothetical protein